jgi:hypothetical protein
VKVLKLKLHSKTSKLGLKILQICVYMQKHNTYELLTEATDTDEPIIFNLDF